MIQLTDGAELILLDALITKKKMILACAHSVADFRRALNFQLLLLCARLFRSTVDKACAQFSAIFDRRARVQVKASF